MCVCVCLSVCLSVLSLDLRDHKISHSDKLSMNGTGCEKSELHRFFLNVSLRRYGSFNSLVELHLKLPMSIKGTKK